MGANIGNMVYDFVVFRDVNNDAKFLTRSTIKPNQQTEVITWEDGKSYPVIDLPISAESHPFYIGKKVSIKEMSSVAKFNAKYGRPTKKGKTT